MTQTAVRTPLEKMCRSFPAAYEKSNGWWTHDDNPRFDFLETEDGTIRIYSHTGRTAENVLAMGNPSLKLADLYPKSSTRKPVYREKQFDLLTLSEYLKLDWRFLYAIGYRDGYPYKNKMGRRTVCVKLGGYCDPKGNEHSKVKVRLSIDGKVRFLWDKSTPGEPIPCGLHRLDEARRAGYLIMGEGESDAATMWFHGFPFLGIGGSDTVKQLDAALLQGIGRIYIIEEPDQAKKNSDTGQGFYASMRAHLRDNGYTGEIFSIRFKLACGYKDPSNLHKAIYRDCDQAEEAPHLAVVKAKFAAAMAKAIERAIPEGNTALATQEDVQPEPTPPMPTNESEWRQWAKELCRVSTTVLSPAHKIVLLVILLYAPIWNEPGEFWWKVEADDLCDLAAMPKATFLKHLAYLTDKVGLFTKRHVHIWYTPEEVTRKRKKCTTDLYIQPSAQKWLAYPSTYHIVEGAEERNHGGTRTPKPTCAACGSEHVDLYDATFCHDCKHLHYIPKQDAPERTDEHAPAEAVESTAELLPTEEEKTLPKNTPATPNLHIPSPSISGYIYDPQVALSSQPEENTPGNPKLGVAGVSPTSEPIKLPHCQNMQCLTGPNRTDYRMQDLGPSRFYCRNHRGYIDENGRPL